MQLYASDKERPIYVAEAERKKEYLCLECHRTVRLRGGRFRQKHFYHTANSPCRQSGKSLLHLSLQLHLLQLLPEGEAEMEKAFPSKGRIADVVWHEKKIIFEVQCSFLSQEEAEKRCEDYAALGYSLVWLLSDKLFNRNKSSPSEVFLRKQICFFFRSFPAKNPLFYDQHERIKGGFRVYKSPLCQVFLQTPHPTPCLSPQREKALPIQIRERLKKSTLYFQGDIVHRSLLLPAEALFQKVENRNFSKKAGNLFHILVKRPYFSLLEVLLRACSK